MAERLAGGDIRELDCTDVLMGADVERTVDEETERDGERERLVQDEFGGEVVLLLTDNAEEEGDLDKGDRRTPLLGDEDEGEEYKAEDEAEGVIKAVTPPKLESLEGDEAEGGETCRDVREGDEYRLES